LGIIEYSQGNYEQAQKLYEESLILFREIGDKHGIADSINNLGRVSQQHGNYEQARKYYEENLAIRRGIAEKSISLPLINLGNLAYSQKNYQQTRKYYEESLNISRELGEKNNIVRSLIGLAGILSNIDHLSCAVKLLGAIETALKSMGSVIFYTAEQKRQEQIINELREILGVTDFDKYWEDGKKMTLEEACQLVVNS
jgi:tetratricopeptide (TPR) repeat protein